MKECAEQFDFIKRFADRYGVPRGKDPSDPIDLLYSVGQGAGLSNLKRAGYFLTELFRSIPNIFENKLRVFQCDLSDKLEGKGYVRKVAQSDPSSWELLKTYLGFNPSVVAAYVDDTDDPKVSLLNVLMREDLTKRDVEDIVTKAERWRDFFSRAYQEFGLEGVFDYFPDSRPILAVEDVALRADPTLNREYKDTGTARLYFFSPEKGGFVRKHGKDGSVELGVAPDVKLKVFAEGVRRISGISEVRLRNVFDEKLKVGLNGRKVDFHVDSYSIGPAELNYSGSLLRILD